MARGINKVILVGTLGADPETRYTQAGNAITSFRLATNESWTDKNTGQKQERTEWHRCKAFGRLAEIVGEYARKGRQVYAEGSLRTDKYTDKDGIERYSTDIVVDTFQLLGGNPEGRQSQGGEPYTGRPREERQAQAPRRQQVSGEVPRGGLDMGGFSDDIPF